MATTKDTPVGLRMVGGTGTGSFHHFSRSLQSTLNVFFLPQLSQTIADSFSRQLLNNADAEAVHRFAIADFGCSCAGSTIESMQFIAQCLVDRACASRASDLRSPQPRVYIQAFFNDLPSNDFNALFALLSSSQSSTSETGLRFIPCGLPGSFYSRLFPPGYLHIGLCTLALHYLSKVPDAVQNPNSPAWNENGTWISEGCRAETAMAYKEQFLDDLTCFLQLRSQELVPGGLLFCVIISSKPAGEGLLHRVEKTKMMDHLHTAWRQLISEGLLDQRSLDEFNFPVFLPTLEEVREAVHRPVVEANFEVLDLESVEVEKAPKHVWMETAAADGTAWGRTCEMMVRNFVGSFIQSHLGDTKFEVLMERLRSLAAASDDSGKFVNMMDVTVLALLRR